MAYRPYDPVPVPPVFVPDCVDVEPRLLKCVPRRRFYPSEADRERLKLAGGPPRRTVRPYPTLFARPYGPY